MDPKTRYAEKLKDPRWQRKRLEVFQRDNFTCRRCGSSSNTLAVHHLYYKRCEPWEYPMDALTTLCEECHKNETEFRPEAEQRLIEATRVTGWTADEVDFIASVLFSLGNDGPDTRMAFVNFLNNGELAKRLLAEYREEWNEIKKALDNAEPQS